MDPHIVIEYIPTMSALVAVVSFILGLRTIRRQMTLQVVMKYTERYEKIMEAFPQKALIFRLDGGKLPAQDMDLTISVLKYLNLCSEEFYLSRRNYFSKELWGIWETDMDRMIASPLVRREWATINQEFASHPDFFKYVTRVQSSKHTAAAAASV